jgi:hypothetical protein
MVYTVVLMLVADDAERALILSLGWCDGSALGGRPM